MVADSNAPTKQRHKSFVLHPSEAEESNKGPCQRHSNGDVKTQEHVFPLPQAEHQKGDGHNKPDGQAVGETLADGKDENGENRHEQEFGQVHVGQGVAPGKQT